MLTFLGTGTSQGVPVIGCDCEVCQSVDYRDKRLRTSAHLQIGGKSIIIDSGPDFRQQVLRERIKKLDALIYTHEHKDHTSGLDDIRAYNFLQHRDMPLYGEPRVLAQIKKEFAYIFTNATYPGVPRVELYPISEAGFVAEGISFQPIRIYHHKLPILGFRVGNLSYITDANFISEESKKIIQGSEIIVLNALRREPHISHFSLEEAIDLLMEFKPKKAYLTHISHLLGLHHEVEAELPDFIRLAYDGLKVGIS
ncbi:MBL fold metallo-hydrolase [Adhaeribacter pallidiroseus]|uniref:Phosphoribosyl 1,2-cyclic phosphate phosphodiesterase n=1 Tax=Adhaeribacter pallidiroseus TaxID=2072847 RepID=A0A369QKL1_9BACT|nr:MBL fold metallo-hydrolase [Adhaeribacter pallidiroseus]RDC64185.1 Phosphoribosyl 1,2-cyclic phosphate phosphodiesterase [Adhaeribacter pallidiroseus]